MTNIELPGYPGGNGSGRAAQLREQEKARRAAGYDLSAAVGDALTTLTDALAASDRLADSRARLRDMANKGRGLGK